MHIALITLSIVVSLLLGVWPLAEVVSSGAALRSASCVLALLNLVAWALLAIYVSSHFHFRNRVSRVAKGLGIDTRFKSLPGLLEDLLREAYRRKEAFAVNLLERRISSKQELSRALEHLVSLSYKLLNAESAELALFDRESGSYHSSFVMGKPFRSSAQAMLSGAAQGDEGQSSPEVLVQPISFAGSVLGSIRVGLQRGQLPSSADRETMQILALQSGLAIVNAQYTGELLQMKRVAEESVRAKTGFLANLSHELRGPLGIMSNAVELVLDGLCGPVTQDQAETLQMVRSNGDHLLELINDVLDYAKVESGKIIPQRVDILVDEILKDIIGVVRKQAEAKGHKLIYRASDEALSISCDRRHLRQMLINLLTNAIKYTPNNGQIEVWAERVPINKIRINVRDSGIGIEEENRHKVFAAFERIENTYALSQTGSGLGMPLSRRLAEVNGGLIDFRSSAGKGSQFWLMFPAIQYSAAAQEKTVKAEGTPVIGRGEAVLIIEKDQGERNMVCRYLSRVGFETLGCTSRLEAVETLRKREVRLIIVGNTSAEDSGEKLVSGIRASVTGARMSVLVITSRAFAFDTENYLKAGIDRCLVKPVKLRDLGAICRELIDGTYGGTVVDRAEIEVTKTGEGPTRLVELDEVLN